MAGYQILPNKKTMRVKADINEIFFFLSLFFVRIGPSLLLAWSEPHISFPLQRGFDVKRGAYSVVYQWQIWIRNVSQTIW